MIRSVGVLAAAGPARVGNRRQAAAASGHQQNVKRAEGEAWILVYLDVITLLLASFVMLLVFAKRESIQVPVVKQPDQIVEQQATPRPVPEAVPADAPLAEELRRNLRAIQGEEVDVQVEQGRINLHLPESILFDTGKADLLEVAGPVLDSIVPALLDTRHPISVEGHTDNVPIQTAQFPSNWELSSARASVVIRYLQEKGVARTRLKAVGFADTQPVAGNDSETGRSANRRVTLVIHVDTAEPDTGPL